MRFALLMATLAIAGCDGGTPVKYEVCDEGGKDCFVTARFKDFDACERYRSINDLVAAEHGCEARGGQVVCRQGIKTGAATTHCTR